MYYFVESPVGQPLAGTISAKELAAVGLGHLADPTGVKLQSGKQIQVTACTGPSGKPGTFLWVKRSVDPEPPHLQYAAGEQTWIERAGVWIGWPNDTPISPASLERERVAGTALITDAYDRQWKVPIARRPPDPYGDLATYFSIGTDSKSVRKLHAYESKLWEAAEAIAPRLFDNENPLSVQEGIEFTIAALTRNYRLSALELSAMESLGQPLLDAGFIFQVPMAVCHFDFLLTLSDQKKT